MKIAVIPARGQSRRLPRKNILPFHGKPLIAHSIETALASGLFDQVYVSTEDHEIGAIAERYGAKVLRRDPKLAELDGAPDPGTQEITAVSIENLQAGGNEITHACCIYATAPLMLAKDLHTGWNAVEVGESRGIDFAMSVGIRPVRDAGQWYWGTARAFLDREPLSLMGANVMKVVLPDDRIQDINNLQDFQRAERLYALMHKVAA